MGLRARIEAAESALNRERNLIIARVYGGVSFGGGIEAAYGGTTLQIHEGESIDDFVSRAECAAIEARESFVAIMGLQH